MSQTKLSQDIWLRKLSQDIWLRIFPQDIWLRIWSQDIWLRIWSQDIWLRKLSQDIGLRKFSQDIFSGLVSGHNLRIFGLGYLADGPGHPQGCLDLRAEERRLSAHKKQTKHYK